jgi:putative addiction module antidote
MAQKIIAVGNSAAVTIPSGFLEKAEMKIGDQVLVETDLDKKMVIVKPQKTQTAEISQEFADKTDDFIEKYRSALEELAKK